MIYLDTHVAVWLYASGAEALSESAVELITESDDVRVSPMVRLELQYLYEIGRVTEPAATVLDALHIGLGLTVCTAPFAAVVAEADGMDWTRDPFDRLIVAQATLNEAPLVTKNESLHQNYGVAIW